MIAVKKGYTIAVTSWENDGDNYRTKSITVDSKEKTEAIVKLCDTVFQSCHNYKGFKGIGNMMEDEGEHAREIILPFMKANPVLCNGETNDDVLVEICENLKDELMGGSEWYYSRVCEKVIVTYSDKDIEVEEVKF